MTKHRLRVRILPPQPRSREGVSRVIVRSARGIRGNSSTVGGMLMTPLHIETPLIESRPLSACSERSIWLKMEAFQPTGSFKLRGIGRACQEFARRGAARFVSSSGGNAGIAVAYAGRQLGVPVTVVVPESTSDHARALLRQQAAKVIVHGPSWQEANAYAQSLISEND